MKQILKILIAFFLFGIGTTRAQEIITPGGDYFSNSNSSMSSTIGEPISETFAGSENLITQGFQQSKLTIIAIRELPGLSRTITAFPNPAKEYVKIKTDNLEKEKLWIELYDNSGKLLQKKQFDGSETEISFSSLKPATYHIKVISGKKEVKIFKIVKQ